MSTDRPNLHEHWARVLNEAVQYLTAHLPPEGFTVAVIVRNHANPMGHMFVGTDTTAGAAQCLAELAARKRYVGHVGPNGVDLDVVSPESTQ